MSYYGNWGGNQSLLVFQRPGLHLALHGADPTVLGNLATELAGGGYARQPITFSVPSGKATASTIDCVFSGTPDAVLAYLAVWTAVTSAELVAVVQLLVIQSVHPSGRFLVPKGDVAFVAA